eukprot:scaffold71136_cov67-Phaeocystis_antarctica.AAC.5
MVSIAIAGIAIVGIVAVGIAAVPRLGTEHGLGVVGADALDVARGAARATCLLQVRVAPTWSGSGLGLGSGSGLWSGSGLGFEHPPRALQRKVDARVRGVL